MFPVYRGGKLRIWKFEYFSELVSGSQDVNSSHLASDSVYTVIIASLLALLLQCGKQLSYTGYTSINNLFL